MLLTPGGLVGGAGGPRLVTQNLNLEVSRGNVLGAEPFGAFGRIESGGALSEKVIWPGGTFVIPDPAGINIDLVSSSANDTNGGSGVNSVKVHYLDVNLAQQEIIVPLNGTTPVVNAITGVRFIQCMHIHTIGTPYTAANGDITASNAGQLYSIIPTDDVRCASSARMVPAGKRAVIIGLVGSSISGTAAASAEVSINSSEFYGVQYNNEGLFFPSGAVGMQDNSQAFDLPIPNIFSSETVILMKTNVDKAAIITG